MNSLAKADELRRRTKDFAIRIVRVFRSLPRAPDAQTLGKQLLRSGTSVAANYRAVCRARSKAEFIAKMGIVVEEADETVFWLELMSETGIIRDGAHRGSSERSQRVGGDIRSIITNAKEQHAMTQFLNDSMTQYLPWLTK